MSSRRTVLNFCFTHPKHRRRGAGQLLMEWGIRKADKLGLASYIEATDIGLTLYEAHGFKVEGDIDLDATTENPSEEFIQLREKLGCPIHGWFMRRPKHGKAE
jgi:GNAT superfamily N-acetyltransferase